MEGLVEDYNALLEAYRKMQDTIIVRLGFAKIENKTTSLHVRWIDGQNTAYEYVIFLMENDLTDRQGDMLFYNNIVSTLRAVEKHIHELRAEAYESAQRLICCTWYQQVSTLIDLYTLDVKEK